MIIDLPHVYIETFKTPSGEYYRLFTKEFGALVFQKEGLLLK